MSWGTQHWGNNQQLMGYTGPGTTVILHRARNPKEPKFQKKDHEAGARVGPTGAGPSQLAQHQPICHVPGRPHGPYELERCPAGNLFSCDSGERTGDTETR